MRDAQATTAGARLAGLATLRLARGGGALFVRGCTAARVQNFL